MRKQTRAELQRKDLGAVVELLGQIGLIGAGVYVGVGATEDAINRLSAFIREKMDGLREAQRQLDRVDPVDDGEMSDSRPIASKGDVVWGRFGNSDGSSEDNPIGDARDFFAQNVDDAEGSSVTLDNMYDAYVQWCQANGYAPMPDTAFKRELLNMGVVRQLIAGRDRWLGVSLKSSMKSIGAHALYR